MGHTKSVDWKSLASKYRFGQCKSVEELRSMLSKMLFDLSTMPDSETQSLTGMAAPGVGLYTLVCQKNEVLSRASQSDTTKPAHGLVTKITGRTAEYAISGVEYGVPVTGDIGTFGLIYLGVNGGLTFTEPTPTGATLSQTVGRAVKSMGGGKYAILVDIGIPSVV
jgi:hypothetical protein